MRKSNLLYLLIISIFWLKLGYSQNKNLKVPFVNKHLQFHLLDVDAGLSHNLVKDIQQDSLGFIWVATVEGLNRYDGNRFVKFKKNNNTQDAGLTNNYIQQLKFDQKGELLIATDDGLNIYNSKTQKFRVVNKKKGLLDNSVSCLAKGPNKSLIIGTYQGGVQFIDQDWKINPLFLNTTALSSNKISSITMQSDSILWVGTFDRGLNKVNFKTKRTVQIPYGKTTAFPSEVINAIYPDSKGNIWIGTRDGLRVVTTKGDTLKLNKSTIPQKGLSDDDILCFEEDNHGHMWIGTRNGGLNIIAISSFLEREKNPVINWFLPETDGKSVYNRTISTIMMDKNYNMWLGTPTGLNFVNPNGEPIKLLQRSAAAKETLSHNRIAALANSSHGKIWIGTDGGGLDLYDPQKKHFKYYKHHANEKKSLSNNYILTVLEDHKHRVWVGTYQGGVNRLNIHTGFCEHYLEGDVENGSDVRVVFEDRKKQIWVGTNQGGLYKYIEKEDRFKYIKTLGKIDIRGMSSDRKGNLWLATFGSGIIKYRPEEDEETIYNSQNTKEMNSNIIFCITTLADGNVLAGTRYGGLIRINQADGQVFNFSEKDGLSNNTISSIIKQNEKYVWLGTFDGLCRYNTKTNEIQNLSFLNNIQHAEFNVGAVLKTKKGKLYFGGNKGLNLFDPKKMKAQTLSYPMVLENLNVSNKLVKITPNQKKGILQKSISYQDHILLNYNQNSFSVDIAALKYPSAKNVTYSYRLENYQNYWINTKGAATVNLSNVPPGEYNLKIKAKTGWSKEASKELKITISPPFWKTFPAYSLYFIAVTLLLYISFKYYGERIYLKNSLLFEKKQRQLEHNLNEERLRFFTGFSHELKTPLTLILAPLELLLTEIKNKKHHENLLFIQRNANSLFDYVNKLLEVKKSEEGLSQLVIGNYNLCNYLKNWIKNYTPLAKERNISLKYSYAENQELFWFDLEKLEIIVNNLLSNAIKYSESNSSIFIILSCDKEYFKIKIQDSGAGISEEDLLHIFEWYYHSNSTLKKSGTGIGLALSKSFAELHKGRITVESNPKKGTAFTVFIPNNKEILNTIAHRKIEGLEMQEENITKDISLKPTSNLIFPRKKEAIITPEKDRELILLIDDNVEILSFLNTILQENYDVLNAQNGREGVEKAIQFVPNLIISDIMMPKRNGLDLCENLKENPATTHIPVILLSAKSNLESILTGYQKGADDYITKPFNSKVLKTRVRNLLDSRINLRQYFLNKSIGMQNLPDDHKKLLYREKEFLEELEIIILENIGKDKKEVELITQVIGMSRTSLYKKMKALTGKNINQYIRFVKIEHAAKLIKSQNYTISQASFEAGFANIKYFRKVFKEHFGVLPSTFKKKVD